MPTTNIKEFAVKETSIPDLLEFDIPVHRDERGWFKDMYNKERMEKARVLAGFTIMQANVSFNETAGVTRGIHAEPWDKYISPVTGSIFAAIVDLRAGDNFGVTQTFTLDNSRALYVPRGCGNSYQALEDDTSYSYLVNGLWSPEDTYTMVNLADETLSIEWPIPLEKSVISDKDLSHPPLSQVRPINS